MIIYCFKIFWKTFAWLEGTFYDDKELRICSDEHFTIYDDASTIDDDKTLMIYK